jgi:membrane protein implicated in regulation of membrane protease activity
MKNAVLFFLLIGANSAIAIGYSGLNTDLEYLYLGVVLFILAVLFFVKAVNWVKQKIKKESDSNQ